MRDSDNKLKMFKKKDATKVLSRKTIKKWGKVTTTIKLFVVAGKLKYLIGKKKNCIFSW